MGDVVEIKKKLSRDEKVEIAHKFIDHINELAGKNYRYIPNTVNGIIVRFNEAAKVYGTIEETIDAILNMIDYKSKDPHFVDNNYKHLNPITLFRPSKFWMYMEQMENE